MKSFRNLILSLVLANFVSLESFAFYCADGSAQFRVEFTDTSGAAVDMAKLKEGTALIGNLRYTDNEFLEGVTFLDSVQSFPAISSLHNGTVYIGPDFPETSQFFDQEDLFSLNIKAKPTGTRVVGGSWLDPDSGEEIPTYTVTYAGFYQDHLDSYNNVDLEDNSMECWVLGDPTLESTK